MKARLSILPLSLSALFAVLTTVPLPAVDRLTSASVRLSAPSRIGVLRINLPGSDLHITGTEGDTVRVDSSLKQRMLITSDQGGDTKQAVPSFTLTEHDNSVSLALAEDSTGVTGRYQISVPRTLSLDIRNKELGGDFIIQEVSGDLEINVVNSAVRLEGVSGSVVVNTVNGQVHVLYHQAPQKILSITSMNGETNLQLPPDTKANVQLRTHHGIIATDFRAAKFRTIKVRTSASNNPSQPAQPATAEAPSIPAALLPPDGKVVSGTLNGGGVDLSIASMNGSIALRQFPPTSSPSDGTKDNVTVNFQDPDNFTDIAEDFPGTTSTFYLDELRDCVQKTAAPLLPAGSTLTVTFTDIDLAGMIRPDRNDVRFMTSTTIPRMRLTFRLLGADGQVLQEGERRLSDMNYQMSIGLIGRNEPLYYDKELLKDWLAKEFKPRS